MPEYVDASPVKRFFVEMLIRDIRLEDAILDLVDNAIDSLIRYEAINLPGLLTSLADLNEGDLNAQPRRQVSITIQKDEFRIVDNCGGIEVANAREHVFRFGADVRPEDARLSVYGIGLKRAVLKIGRDITVESKTLESGFRVVMNVDEFESNADVWKFPIEMIPKANNREQCGTTITIRDINEETKNRLRSSSFEGNLIVSIGESYSLFLEKFVDVKFNQHTIAPISIPISNSVEVVTSLTKTKFEDVNVIIVAGLQSLYGSDWKGHTAGWYIICNGRVVVFADRTSLTGWGEGLPIFQPKHRGFIGIVLFLSDDPEALPWTTTKRGVNAESAVFQYIRERMITDARPVISFLDRRYSSVPVSSENTDNLEVKDRPLQTALQPASINTLFSEEPRRFSPSAAVRQKTKSTSVQYRTERSNIERAKEAIGDRSMAAGKVGLHALEYFLANETKNGER